jgi:hypothetical protein
MIKLGDAELRTSSYTVTNACVEVGSDSPDRVLVADSKFNHTEQGLAAKTALALSPAAFTALIEHVRV